MCKDINLIIKRSRNTHNFTKAGSAAQKVENLIKQYFTAQAPKAKWLTDITEILYKDGKLYLAPIFTMMKSSKV